MSIVKLNKKLYTITLIVILMLVIVVMSDLFKAKIEYVAVSNNNIEEFHEYILNEGEHIILLPEQWEINKVNKINSNFYLEFSNKEDIVCEVRIIDGVLEDFTSMLLEKKSNNLEEIGEWNIIKVSEKSDIDKYYIKNYSEGKILILKFSYNDIKEKDGIDIVFNIIANNFK